MRMFLFLFAVFFFLTPAKNEFFNERCNKLNGKCLTSCHKNEEIVGLCKKSKICCLDLQPCG
ncbi:beta-defensin 106A-like [Ochotona princeps]|uniref:beta-defensin 106A-like n=1 Tax=Ochotona princeps TaxID=9978 RepID=UPI002714D4CD|nr:beta-defensin 106A-like [Ochotona princeps]